MGKQPGAVTVVAGDVTKLVDLAARGRRRIAVLTLGAEAYDVLPLLAAHGITRVSLGGRVRRWSVACAVGVMLVVRGVSLAHELADARAAGTTRTRRIPALAASIPGGSGPSGPSVNVGVPALPLVGIE